MPTITSSSRARPAINPTAFSIGHSRRSVDDFASLLRQNGVQTLVDVRKMPRSRTHPQFNVDLLPGELAPRGIHYIHVPELGGLRPKHPSSRNDGWTLQSFRNYADYAQTPEFRRGLDALLRHVHDAPTAIMCAEAVWWRCHRRIITDYLLARDVDVVHLFSPTQSEPAKMTPFARVESDGTLSYRASALPPPPAETVEPDR